MRGNYKFPIQLFYQTEKLIRSQVIYEDKSNRIYNATYSLVSDYKNLFPNNNKVLDRVYDELFPKNSISSSNVFNSHS